ncbi:MAG TPA: DinB family protein [Acidobacteriaceae bacterium]|nr:DinB family protein [Acidobacteriaceae bacterium]
MRFRGLLCAGMCLALAGPAVTMGQEGGAASAQKPFTPAPIAPADSLSALESLLQSEVVSAADAMPADKYDFAPPATYGTFAGVRTFGQQVKHLAESNYEFFQGWSLPGAVDSKTIEALKTKDDIMKALKDSYTYLNAAIASITPDNAFMSVQGPAKWKLTRASTATFALAHSMDHYGQMVEYLRMNGIVPPASRQQGSM